MSNAIRCGILRTMLLLATLAPVPVLRAAWQKSAEARPAAVIDHGLRIMMTGHSFHWGIQPVLADIAQAAGLKDQQIVGCQRLGGSRVLQHWQLPDGKNVAKAALKTGKIDVLTTSPHRLLPDEGIDKFVELALQHNPAVRVTVQQSWAPWDNGEARPQLTDRNAMDADKLLKEHAAFFRQLDEQLRDINKRYSKPVVLEVPVGKVVIALREKVRLGQAPGVKTQDELFRDKMGHPGPVITTLSACCHFAVIYRRSPVGLPVPAALKKLPQEHQASLTRLLQELAWETVCQTPFSGVGPAGAVGDKQ